MKFFCSINICKGLQVECFLVCVLKIDTRFRWVRKSDLIVKIINWKLFTKFGKSVLHRDQVLFCSFVCFFVCWMSSCKDNVFVFFCCCWIRMMNILVLRYTTRMIWQTSNAISTWFATLQGLDLLPSLLAADPKTRITALSHDYLPNIKVWH